MVTFFINILSLPSQTFQNASPSLQDARKLLESISQACKTPENY